MLTLALGCTEPLKHSCMLHKTGRSQYSAWGFLAQGEIYKTEHQMRSWQEVYLSCAAQVQSL